MPFPPLIIIDTQTAAISLDVNRRLNMGIDCRLRFVVPDQNVVGGVRILHEYKQGFDRMSEVEREVGDGKTVIVDIADLAVVGTYPVGQLRQDITMGKSIQFYIDGVVTQLYEMNDVPDPAFNEPQVYRIVCGTETLKRTYVKAGHRR